MVAWGDERSTHQELIELILVERIQDNGFRDSFKILIVVDFFVVRNIQARNLVLNMIEYVLWVSVDLVKVSIVVVIPLGSLPMESATNSVEMPRAPQLFS